MEKKLSWFRPAFTAIILTLAGIFVIYLVYDMLFLPKLQISQRQVLHNYAYNTPYYIGNIATKEGFLSPTIEKVSFYGGTNLLSSQDISLYLYKGQETTPFLTSSADDFGGNLVSAEGEKLPSTPFQLIYLVRISPENEGRLKTISMRITFSYFGIIKRDQHYTISFFL